MFEKPIIYIVIVAIITIFLARRIKIAQEGERFSVHVLGRFKCFKDSGLHIKISGSESVWTRIKADDRGKIVTNNLMRVHDVEIPYKSDQEIKLGAFARISGFENERAFVVLDTDQRTSFVCEKCGHNNILR